LDGGAVGVEIDWPIVPGSGVGPIRLGLPEAVVQEALGPAAHRESRGDGTTVFHASGMSVWIRQGIVEQICVSEPYCGLLLGSIHLGHTLRDVERLVGPWKPGPYEIVPTFELVGHDGVCLELSDLEGDMDWSELDAPISSICVFSPSAGH
jgi:hypothetical protein